MTATRPRHTRLSVSRDFARRPRTPEPEPPDEWLRRFETCRCFMARVLKRRAAICYTWVTQRSAGSVKSNIAFQFGGQSRVALASCQLGAALRGFSGVSKTSTLSVRGGKHFINHRDLAARYAKCSFGQLDRARSISD